MSLVAEDLPVPRSLGERGTVVLIGTFVPVFRSDLPPPALRIRSAMSDRPMPFPESLCHRCAAPPRYVETAASTFILCPILPDKYPPQPVRVCPMFRPRDLPADR